MTIAPRHSTFTSAPEREPPDRYDAAIPPPDYTARVTNALPNAVAQIVEQARQMRAARQKIGGRK